MQKKMLSLNSTIRKLVGNSKRPELHCHGGPGVKCQLKKEQNSIICTNYNELSIQQKLKKVIGVKLFANNLYDKCVIKVSIFQKRTENLRQMS